MCLSSLGQMGFNVGESQYLTAPPYAAGALLMIATAWVGDRFHIRGPLIIFNCIVTIVGLTVMAYLNTKAVQYFGVFLTVMGLSSNIPTIMAYQSNNIVGQWKRAMSSAIFVGMGGVGGIAGALVFRSQDAPRYRPGIIACLTSVYSTTLTGACLPAVRCNALMMLIVAGLSVYFTVQNNLQRKRSKVLEGMVSFTS